MSGGFERAETEFAIEQARPGTVAIDVGANVGMFTVPLALAVGPSGRVLTIEPSPENVERLERNLDLNSLENVVVEPIAVGDKAGRLVLQLASDPGFHSTAEVAEPRGIEENLTVRAETLDQVWLRAHAPAVSFIKIDTEGSEDAVLRGAEQILRACQPVLLVEAKGDNAASRRVTSCTAPRRSSHARHTGVTLRRWCLTPAFGERQVRREARVDRIGFEVTRPAATFSSHTRDREALVSDTRRWDGENRGGPEGHRD